MSKYIAIVSWKRTSAEFLKGKYSREHTWTFDGGLTLAASSSPAVVPTPYSNPANLDPEEAFVASISSCHMLTFLFLASKEGFIVDSYQDEAVGTMVKNDLGVAWIALVMLHPKIVYNGEKQPNGSEAEKLHHAAHEQCFIANSVRTEIRVV
jgi:organic hydroperoxide reductase OsmC/OhrA